jgi:hypothetical protein
MAARHIQARSRKTDSEEEQSDAALKRAGSEGQQRVNQSDGPDRGWVEYEPGPDPQAFSNRYGIDIGQREARRLQQLESEFGN